MISGVTDLAIGFERDTAATGLVISCLAILAQNASVGASTLRTHAPFANALTSLDAFFTALSYPASVLAARIIAFQHKKVWQT